MSLKAMRAVRMADILCVAGGDFWFGAKVRRYVKCKWNCMAGAWSGLSDAKGRMTRMREDFEEDGAGQWLWRMQRPVPILFQE